MYLQITTKCNMMCAHCGFSCTKDGKYMSLAVARQSINLLNKHFPDGSYADMLTLGGGEPTIHPNFWDILAYARKNLTRVAVVTNGKRKYTSLDLIDYAIKNNITVELSLDKYHEAIDPEVVNAFKSAEHGNIKIRTCIVTNNGRAKLLSEKKVSGTCFCSTPFADPAGTIWACGCKEVNYGTVFNPLEKVKQLLRQSNSNISTCTRFCK